MGMAHRPPENGKRARYYISKHALDRLRQRTKVLIQYDDMDICGLVNEAVEKAVHATAFREIIDSKGAPARLVDLTNTLDPLLAMGSVWALVKSDVKDGDREAVVTIVENSHANRMLDQGKWLDDGDLEPFNPAFSSLKDVKVAAAHPVTPSEAMPAIDKAAQFTELSKAAYTPQYLVLGPGKEVFKVGGREEVTQFVAHDESMGDLQIFKECKFRVVVVTTVEMED